MEWSFVLISAAIIAAVIYVFYAAYAAAKRRRRELAAWAKTCGFSFDASRNVNMQKHFPGAQCVHLGERGYANNVMQGERRGLRITAFDYHYTSGERKVARQRPFSVVAVKSPVSLKPLLIHRERLADKVKGALGFKDIQFESEEFNRTFYVTAPDQRWAYDVVHQRMMQYLMSAPDFPVQFDRAHVIVWHTERFKPLDFEAAAELGCGIIERLPEYVVQRQAEKT